MGTMPRGGSARDRRKQRRADERRDAGGVQKAPDTATPALVAGASIGSTGEAMFGIEIPLGAEGVLSDQSELSPERAALAAVADALQHNVKCSCGHHLSEHTGSDGPCNHEDGRGTCSCGGFAELTAEGHMPSNDREAVLAALTAAGVEATPRLPLTTYELTQGNILERRFYAEVMLAGYGETSRASWPCEATLGEHGEVLERDDSAAVFRLPGGALAFVRISHGWLSANIAAPERELLGAVLSAFSTTYPPLYLEQGDENTVPITFWTNSNYGPTSRLRMIEAASWEEIAGNYAAEVRDELERMVSGFEPGKDGQLLLWQGPPGTGKTWALRALASEWRDWAEFHYITDPDSFFVSDPSYMIDVLLHDTYEELSVSGANTDPELVTSSVDGKWRVLILEDTGELLSAKAKESQGQGLSRLLNVVDGMVGQGLRVLALVTTNDELGELHPAVVRPGRCASQVEFGPLSAAEASAWLGSEVEAPATLAELYAQRSEGFDAFAESPTEVVASLSQATQDRLRRVSEDLAAYYGTNLEEATERLFAAVPASGPLALPEEMQPSEVLPAPNPSPQPPVTEQPTRSDRELAGMRWTAQIVPMGLLTDDGRAMAPGAITWRELPLTLMAQIVTAEGHDEAVVAGRIDRIWQAGDWLMAEGVFDSGEFGSEIARLVGEQTLRGVSVDLAIHEYEVGPKSDYFDEVGNWLSERPEQPEVEPSLVELLFGDEQDEDVIFVVTEAVIGAVTVCSFPAFAEASISVADSLVAGANPAVWTVTQQAGWTVTAPRFALTAGGSSGWTSAATTPDHLELATLVDAAEALTAAAAGLAPLKPPAEWFEVPALEGPTPLTITEDGRIYGHAWCWDSCHLGFPDVCVTAPHSRTENAYFHLGEVECEDGERIACGKITLETGHANRRLSRVDASAHYDDTGTAVADVVSGEDEYGGWVAGALRPDVDAETARDLRAAVLSGDWRDVNGHLELVALLAVNVPGFPVPRPRALVSSGDDGPHVLALVAAGIRLPSDQAIEAAGLSSDDLAKIGALRDRAAGRFAALAARAGKA